MTRPYAEVIGDPIAHSKSPLIHNFWLAKLGIDAEYRARHVRSDELEDYFTRRRGDAEWRGCNVTMPHKQSIQRFVDGAETMVKWAGAANTVYRRGNDLLTDNTDTLGVLDAFPLGVGTVAPVCIIGAGGAARAVIAALDNYAVFQFNIVARERSRGGILLDTCGMAGAAFRLEDAGEAMTGCVGTINASPLGMVGFPEMPDAVIRGLARLRRRGLSFMRDRSFAFDLVYAPLRTPFLAAAERARLRTVDGLVMLVGQAAASFARFFGQPAPREHDTELRSLLTQ